MGKGLGKAVAARNLVQLALLAVCLLSLGARAAAPETGAPPATIASFDDAGRVTERNLAQISGASSSHGSPQLPQTGLAVILWDERTKVRGAVSAGTNWVAGVHTVNAGLTVH